MKNLFIKKSYYLPYVKQFDKILGIKLQNRLQSDFFVYILIFLTVSNVKAFFPLFLK